ncbi:PACE efflux transporter [Roseicyclus sp. F158]|uniref:PACE efflux transporter n=1 Tax=Tropicimonas omnivorans TaxID=3075590 RepID=A0ABU3DHJ6_9RHOB|nr:PACE efflux transporter [Roseicyclus sp. F158]MDT0683009.1 PACE efflux transporter [Roseicyclus sp. F158]
MRSTADRVRQAICFELIGILIVTPLFAWVFNHPMGDMGVLVVLGATAATVWNYLFNLGFDHALHRRRGDARKTFPLRILHAVLFEATLLVILLPIFAWWLQVSLVSAFLMEIAFAAFYVVYAFVFTWCYDTLFPPQGTNERTA